MEELLRNEELENTLTAGAVTVRRRNFTIVSALVLSRGFICQFVLFT